MKILVGYKKGELGKTLLDLAIHRAKPYSGEVFVVTSLFGEEGTTREQIAKAEENLAYAKQYLDENGIRNQTHSLIRGNSPGEDLVDFAKKNAVDEIIIGVRNRSKVGKLIFGSTAQFVILKSDCPVTSVK